MIKRLGAGALSVLVAGVCLFCMGACSTDTYVPEAKEASLLSPTIGKDGVLRVGVKADNSPYAGQTDSGIVGINIDIAAAIADEYGLKLEIIDIGSDPVTALDQGSVDIVLGLDKSESYAGIWVSDSYIESAVALFSTDATAEIPLDSSVKIASQMSSLSAWEVNRQYGEDALVTSTELETAFSDLLSGRVDYVAADAVIGTFAVHKNEGGATITGLLQKPHGFGIGVAETNDALKQTISDTLVKLQGNGIFDIIKNKWLGSPLNLDAIPVSDRAEAVSTTDLDEGSEEAQEEDAQEESQEDTLLDSAA